MIDTILMKNVGAVVTQNGYRLSQKRYFWRSGADSPHGNPDPIRLPQRRVTHCRQLEDAGLVQGAGVFLCAVGGDSPLGNIELVG